MENVFSQLIDYNLKGICLSKECDSKLDELWKSIHNQILLDEKVRIIKYFFTEEIITKAVEKINSNRLKKLDLKCLQTNTEEYDPFLVEKLAQLFETNHPNFTNKKTVKWISD